MNEVYYPITLTPDADGGFIITFKDLPEAITQADSMDEVLSQAIDCLEEAIANRLALGLAIPKPSPPTRGQITALVKPRSSDISGRAAPPASDAAGVRSWELGDRR